MDTTALIRQRLAVLSPQGLEIFDDSHEHVGHAGARGRVGWLDRLGHRYGSLADRPGAPRSMDRSGPESRARLTGPGGRTVRSARGRSSERHERLLDVRAAPGPERVYSGGGAIPSRGPSASATAYCRRSRRRGRPPRTTPRPRAARAPGRRAVGRACSGGTPRSPHRRRQSGRVSLRRARSRTVPLRA